MFFINNKQKIKQKIGMNSASLPLDKLQVLQEMPELKLELEKILPELLGSPITETKDFSIGTDQIVIYVKTLLNNEAIIKAPRNANKDSNDPSFFPMHLPFKQAWLLNLLQEYRIPSPNLIFLDPENKFFVETFIPEKNFQPESKEDKKTVYAEVSAAIRLLHQIGSNKFGFMVLDRDNEGRYDNWINMFDDHIDNIEKCHQSEKIGDDVMNKLIQLFEEQKEYLRSFNDPRIVHADLSNDNFRVKRVENQWHLSALIDFADTIAGDPLYDLGAFITKCNGDWEIIWLTQKDYLSGGEFSLNQKKVIQFYATYYCTWILSCTENQQETEKWKKTLENILSPQWEEF